MVDKRLSYTQQLLTSSAIGNVLEMLSKEDRLFLRHFNQKIANNAANNFFADPAQGSLKIDLDDKQSNLVETLKIIQRVASLQLENLDATSTVWGQVDQIAQQIGGSVHSLSLSFDGKSNYSTEFISCKDVLKKFDKLRSLTLNLYSGGNLQMITDYLVRVPHQFPWWTSLEHICLNEIHTQDCDKDPNFLNKFVKLCQNLQHIELYSTQDWSLLLSQVSLQQLAKVTFPLPQDRDQLTKVLNELHRLKVKNIEIVGQRENFNPIEDVFWPAHLEHLSITRVDKPLESLIKQLPSTLTQLKLCEVACINAQTFCEHVSQTICRL